MKALTGKMDKFIHIGKWMNQQIVLLIKIYKFSFVAFNVSYVLHINIYNEYLYEQTYEIMCIYADTEKHIHCRYADKQWKTTYTYAIVK